MRKMTFMFVALLFAMTVGAQDKIQITGAVSGTDSVLVFDLSQGMLRAKIPVREGRFSTTIPVEKQELLGIGSLRSYIPFFADGNSVEIDFNTHTTKGSELNMLAGRCDYSLDSLATVYTASIRKMREGVSSPGDMEELMSRYNNEREGILKQYAHTMIPAIYLPDMVMQLTYAQIEPWLKPDAPYMSHPRMATAIRFAEGMKKKQPGLLFTDLVMRDMDGRERKLSEWCGKGNYVLVDFWASWCAPCRKEMPNVVESYLKYHSKGYEIVGVSFDNQAPAWKAAVKNMGMDWPQISDLKGWESAAAEVYGVMGIPSNILLDGEGRIVASELRGERLFTKLKEIYGF